ncbi:MULTISPECIES: TetR/AcrR family transcriptional regulator [Streptomyces]|uniref:TetR/AcrR family transcriptional regulator n=1 Tax=Streptomyces ardesiacus TaxID=285564 RepID=A0ABW8HHZ4_9ACTN|nr:MULTISPECIES: TetR/AcrR family transcriptional regulator [Streptomyces]NEB64249.1 TetR family transcriptional regulator [Streptomyces diastaticus]KOU11690.1 TetR family transcriptional regulator [Streptomyces sp. NRRL F-4711]KOX27290.1 TetR family transcriptional regulator [Streptomyces sp. NRRL F-4707]KOX45568.1 TetR family transcriptional regulator [Streptomyces sp. NRRL F-7442]MCL7366693.1 TetR/AcrR family transcriptional regulator [Streptomyces ardesiacus]
MTAARGRTGRPPLTDERKAAIRLEIARAAVGLFVAQGVAATTGEQIGQAVGVSARTVWRYFPTKESCVRPLFSSGIDTIAAALREWRPGRPLQEAFDGVWADDQDLAGPDVGALLRLTRTEPGLRAVWLQTRDEAEPAFARALAERAGLPDDDVRPAVWAAMLNAALRAAVEHHAHRSAAPGSEAAPAHADLATTLRTALALAATGLT